MQNSNQGWETYSKLVLQQLETMATGIDGLRTELQDVKSQLTELKAKEDRVQDIKAWKEKIDEKYLRLDDITKRVQKGEDIIGRDDKFYKSDLDKTYPKYLIKNKHKYLEWIV